MNTPHGASISSVHCEGLSSAFDAENVGNDLSEIVPNLSAAHAAGDAAFSSTRTPVSDAFWEQSEAQVKIMKALLN